MASPSERKHMPRFSTWPCVKSSRNITSAKIKLGTSGMRGSEREKTNVKRVEINWKVRKGES